MKDYNKILRDIYEVHNPSKISEIPALLEKYEGQEEQLLEEIYKKYQLNKGINQLKLFNVILIGIAFLFFIAVILSSYKNFEGLNILVVIATLMEYFAIIFLNFNKGLLTSLVKQEKLFISIMSFLLLITTTILLVFTYSQWFKPIGQNLTNNFLIQFSGDSFFLLNKFLIGIFFLITLVNIISYFMSNNTSKLSKIWTHILWVFICFMFLISFIPIINTKTKQNSISNIQTIQVDVNNFIIDQCNILSPSEKGLLKESILSYNQKYNVGVRIYILKDFEGLTRKDFAELLIKRNHINQAYFIILVRPKTDKEKGEVYISYYGNIKNAETIPFQKIIRLSMIPYFKQNDYYNGIKNAINDLYRGIN